MLTFSEILITLALGCGLGGVTLIVQLLYPAYDEWLGS